MIEGADYLINKNFNKLLSDHGVEILDPATGTGTFITDIIGYIPGSKLEYKYKNEIHCNEVSILPYYVANLNIEFTYKQKMGRYAEFKSICFVDTLDNYSFKFDKEAPDLAFTSISEENLERIKHQNEKKISVIIGNPPYNANQLNENENNKNREYPDVDKRIKETYIKESTAQKTKLYDMYSRFFRWASDRLSKNGVLAMITNRSLIDARTYDGFRKTVSGEFNEIYIVDLGGDVRKNPKLSGTKHNVFGIQTGVCISFMIKNESLKSQPCKISYCARPELETAKEKLNFLKENHLKSLNFTHIVPDIKHNWLNITDNDFEKLIPVTDKNTKFSDRKTDETAVFKLYSLGVVTNRDDWVYDFDKDVLKKKINYLIDFYEKERKRWNSYKMECINENEMKPVNDFIDYTIKWTRAVKNDLSKNVEYQYNKNDLIQSMYRPFVKMNLYFNKHLNEMQYQMPHIFKDNKDNKVICVNIGNKDFNILAVNYLPDIHFNGDSQCLPLYTYNEDGERMDNITDWGLKQFREHYEDKNEARLITKEDIFHYTYAVLHNPAYRKKYEQNLKREFPRLPFYDDFRKWADWGKRLMGLHLNYESAEPYPLERVETENGDDSAALFGEREEKPKLKADRENGLIVIDSKTTLKGIPPEAWEYKLGNRSAVEWVLDQYKESKPKDPTIAEKFDSYRFKDYKEVVIDMIRRVCTVSVETVGVVREMGE
jgi:predicted helicase